MREKHRKTLIIIGIIILMLTITEIYYFTFAYESAKEENINARDKCLNTYTEKQCESAYGKLTTVLMAKLSSFLLAGVTIIATITLYMVILGIMYMVRNNMKELLITIGGLTLIIAYFAINYLLSN